ncbi:hypothetical protein HgNV_035 [Homarus gammarus nudivirus]|uniref:Uncharacterized protein n=1 Tax=Homarus gammarus nudivirus TaxID=2509616 RepID=A0A411HB49_9VIRU|nr:hypothetical protein KM727_gp35 [Homarus gammarus nudivirus]QBB28640.1 hypothetical protein HgNV_035 [Homarus gammarus nudivirus]
MYVYKSIYNAVTIPTIYKKNLVLPETENLITFNVYILPTNVSVYQMIKYPADFSYVSSSIVPCYVYIKTEDKLSDSLIDTVETFIQKDIESVVRGENPVTINTFEIVDSAKQAISLYKNITLFIPIHSNELFVYDNYNNVRDNTISCYDSKISYIHLNDRDDVQFLCGKCLRDETVALFNYYPISGGDMVYIIPEDFSIIENTNNKIACIEHNEFVFWLVTTNILMNDTPKSESFMCTKFCPKSQSIEEINQLLKVFTKYKFTNIKIMDSAIAAEDVEHSLLLFVGIYNLQYANKYTKYFELLLSQ